MKKLTPALVTMTILNLSWLGSYLVYLRYTNSCFLCASSSSSSSATDTESTKTKSFVSALRGNYGSSVGSTNIPEEESNGTSDTDANNLQFDESSTENADSIEKSKSSKTSDPSSILCLYTGDEGSTVLSEAFKLHPQVYSPAWRAEPVNAHMWNPNELNRQLDAIRFLLRLPSDTKSFDLDVKKPISLPEYKEMIGNAEATYIKAAVCRKEHNDVEKWTKCMESVLSDLMCGNEEDTINHLILPVRYGFDRACSIYVHSNKDIYNKVSQFAGSTKASDDIRVSISANQANAFRNKQQLYMQEFILMDRLARTNCPDGSRRTTKVHIYDYDGAKEMGMQEALMEIFTNMGLQHDSVDLGRFGGRQPGNYCDRIFDNKSKLLLQQQQEKYEKWLRGACDSDDTYPWCVDQNNV